MSAAELKAVAFRHGGDRMMTLAELCDLVADRAALLVEIKSRFDGDLRLVTRAAKVLANYPGRVALMSFDPAPIAALRTLAPRLPRGIVAERHYSHSAWNPLSARTKRALAYFQHALQSRPQFIAYAVQDLSSAIPRLARNVLRLPLLTWTVRSEVDRARAARYADQMIFEGFRP
jgi:glycerophosphoryl diester phosphodiesterase